MIELWLWLCVLVAAAMATVFAVGFRRRGYAAQLVLVFLCVFLVAWFLRELKVMSDLVVIPVIWVAGFALMVGLIIVVNSERQR